MSPFDTRHGRFQDRSSVLFVVLLRICLVSVLQSSRSLKAAAERVPCSVGDEKETCSSQAGTTLDSSRADTPLEFCNFENGHDEGVCQSCGNITHPAECLDVLGVPMGGKGGYSCAETCLDLRPKKSECSAVDDCESGHSFCDFQFGGTGYCERCFVDSLVECFEMDLTDAGLESCISYCKEYCLTITHMEFSADSTTPFPGFGLIDSPVLDISAPLVDCSDLTLHDIPVCADAANKNAICLVDMDKHLPMDTLTPSLTPSDPSHFAYFYETVWKAERSDCAAVAFFLKLEDNSWSKPQFGFGLGGQTTSIPSLMISPADGRALLDKNIGTIAEFVMYVEEVCDEVCTEAFPCSSSDWYCDYELEDYGICSNCEHDGECFFRGLPERGIQECAKVCGSSPELTFADCKFCPKTVVSHLGSAHEDTKCKFCPEDDLDIEYYDREASLFGSGVRCYLVNEFFLVRDIPVSDQNCQLAQMFNYQCGCKGPGYGGANTAAKRATLVWMPRAMALLSVFGSVFIIYDIMKAKDRWSNKIFNQLMVVLSTFDIFGAMGYAFTSFLTPAEDYIRGSRGNEATCVAQGFLIQLGTTASYINVSLAIYYLLVIHKGWSERRMKKIRIWLFVAPVTVGLSFAFAGIPFYDNTILWCNNSATYWPEVPVAVAIAIATVVMCFLSWDVYKNERTSSRWNMRVRASARNQSDGQSLASKVTWQTFWYLMAFYMTWVPYLALQLMWASGRAFTSYGFILFAGTTVPMQGFWNFFVYIRPRYLSNISPADTIRSTLTMSFRRTSFRRTSSARNTGSDNVGSSMDVMRHQMGESSKEEAKDGTEKTEKETGTDSAFVQMEESPKENVEDDTEKAEKETGVDDNAFCQMEELPEEEVKEETDEGETTKAEEETGTDSA